MRRRTLWSIICSKLAIKARTKMKLLLFKQEHRNDLPRKLLEGACAQCLYFFPSLLWDGEWDRSSEKTALRKIQKSWSTIKSYDLKFMPRLFQKMLSSGHRKFWYNVMETNIYSCFDLDINCKTNRYKSVSKFVILKSREFNIER